MKLDISAALRSPGAEIPFEHQEKLSDQEIAGETVRFPDPVVISGTFGLIADETLLIKGRLRALAHASCARCLSPVTYQVDVPVEESFSMAKPGVPEDEDPWEEKLSFSGSGVEMSYLAQTLTVLDLPIRFLCGDACPGTPVKNQASKQNSEQTLADAHPFSTLSQLITKDQEV